MMASPLRRFAILATEFLVVILLLLHLSFSEGLQFNHSALKEEAGVVTSVANKSHSSAHRKLISPASVDERDRIVEIGCSAGDLFVNQGQTAPLWNGIPTYTVVIINSCIKGCDIRDIHLRCGWFSSAMLVDPSLFKRIKYNDCLVNGGNVLHNGQSITFKYANTYKYPLAVGSVHCGP